MNRSPVDGPVAPNAVGKPAVARDRSRPVTLDEAAWSCPWPAEADALQVNEQTVVLRVFVRADGRADRVDVVSDPGFGFGSAARSCALATRFPPARDSSGQPIAANSPPIRVHFIR
jgi:protein TonB